MIVGSSLIGKTYRSYMNISTLILILLLTFGINSVLPRFVGRREMTHIDWLFHSARRRAVPSAPEDE